MYHMAHTILTSSKTSKKKLITSGGRLEKYLTSVEID